MIGPKGFVDESSTVCAVSRWGGRQLCAREGAGGGGGVCLWFGERKIVPRAPSRLMSAPLRTALVVTVLRSVDCFSPGATSPKLRNCYGVMSIDNEATRDASVWASGTHMALGEAAPTAPVCAAAATAQGAPRTLLLSPSTSFATPRGWQTLTSYTSPLARSSRYDEVHCVGGGSLLLWLLACAGKAPRAPLVYFHGPVVLPTPESCAAWLDRDAPEARTVNDGFEWRRQAISLGAGGTISGHTWLKPLLTTVAAGRSYELGARFVQMQRRWERNGRIVHRPWPADDHAVGDELTRLLSSQHEASDSLPSTVLRCTEAECAVL